ncbi:hypothetical protein ACFL2J_07480 [Candidatus Omnitrophota bacterium]
MQKIANKETSSKKSDKSVLSQNAESTMQWILNSGIQRIKIGGESKGGFNAWYDAKRNIYPFVYPEIIPNKFNAIII